MKYYMLKVLLATGSIFLEDFERGMGYFLSILFISFSFNAYPSAYYRKRNLRLY